MEILMGNWLGILMGILIEILIGILMMDSMGWPYDSSECLLYIPLSDDQLVLSTKIPSLKVGGNSDMVQSFSNSHQPGAF